MVAAGSVFLVFVHFMIFKAKQIWASLMPECINKLDIAHRTSCSQIFSTIYQYIYLCDL